MQAFNYQAGKLFAENVSVEELALRYGTPLYVYSQTHIRERYRAIASAMADVKPLICYSIKANSNAAIIKTLAEEGAGFDIVSGGELFRALRAGAKANMIVFAGVGKTREEIEYALQEQIAFFTCESEPEARRISECAAHLGVKGRIAFRVNPDVDPKTHKYISTGKKENKFGLDFDRTLQAYEMAAALPNIEIAGLHMHIGSQILSAEPFGEALEKVKAFCKTLKAKYPTFRHVDIGGGGALGRSPSVAHEVLPPFHRPLYRHQSHPDQGRDGHGWNDRGNVPAPALRDQRGEQEKARRMSQGSRHFEMRRGS